jgi:hypothetical protein
MSRTRIDIHAPGHTAEARQRVLDGLAALRALALRSDSPARALILRTYHDVLELTLDAEVRRQAEEAERELIEITVGGSAPDHPRNRADPAAPGLFIFPPKQVPVAVAAIRRRSARRRRQPAAARPARQLAAYPARRVEPPGGGPAGPARRGHR